MYCLEQGYVLDGEHCGHTRPSYEAGSMGNIGTVRVVELFNETCEGENFEMECKL